MTTTLMMAPAALAFYSAAQPLCEQLATMARDWRDAAPCDSDALEAYSDFAAVSIRTDLRLSRAQGAGPEGPRR